MMARLLLSALAMLAFVLPSESFLQQAPVAGYHLTLRNRVLLMNRNTDESSRHRGNRKWRRPNHRGKKPHRRRTARDVLDLARLDDSTAHLLRQEPSELDPSQITTLIQQWSHYRKIDERVPRRIEDLVKILVSIQNGEGCQETGNILSIKTYNALLNAWACAALFRTGGDRVAAAQRATVLLRMMQERYDEAVRLGQPNGLIQPDRWSFATVLHVVCRVEGSVTARRLLAWMEMLHDSGRNTQARPSKNDYMQVLDSYLNYKGSRRAILIEGFISHLGHRSVQDPILVLPDTLSYNIAIKAWCDERKKGLPGRQVAEHADRILELMKNDAKGLCRPDVVTYSSKCMME